MTSVITMEAEENVSSLITNILQSVETENSLEYMGKECNTIDTIDCNEVENSRFESLENSSQFNESSYQIGNFSNNGVNQDDFDVLCNITSLTENDDVLDFEEILLQENTTDVRTIPRPLTNEDNRWQHARHSSNQEQMENFQNFQNLQNFQNSTNSLENTNIEDNGYDHNNHNDSSNDKQSVQSAVSNQPVIPVNIVKALLAPDPDEHDRRAEFLKNKDKRHPSHSNVSCEVCGGKARGFHYGADVCTGCKLFFIRNHMKSPAHLCSRRTGVYCPACRLLSCFKAGMDMKANRRGRYSYKLKHEYATKISENNARTGEVSKNNVASEKLSQKPSQKNERNDQITKNKAISQTIPQNHTRFSEKIPANLDPALDETVTLTCRISEAFLSCCIYPPNYFENIAVLSCSKQSVTRIRNNPFSDRGNTINPQRDESEFGRLQLNRYTHVSLCIQNYHNFMKKLPGFNRLPEKEQWPFFIKNLCSLLMVSEYRAYDVRNGIEYHLNGTIATREQIRTHLNPDYENVLFRLVEKLQNLKLDENERNLLKLVGFFGGGFDCTEVVHSVAEKELDVMIRAFDHVVRVNRKNDKMAAVVIGNAMDCISTLHEFRQESSKDFRANFHRFPSKLTNWMKRTFFVGEQWRIQDSQ